MKEEVERGGVIPSNQTGFRKELRVFDNIYVLNYLVNRQLGKRGRLVALFVYLKAVFNSVHRKINSTTMRRRGIKKGITERVVELLRKTS